MDPFDTARTVPVSEEVAGTLQAADGSPVFAVSHFTDPPSDGRPLRTVDSAAVLDAGDVAVPVSFYDNDVLMTDDGRPVFAVTDLAQLA